MNAQHPIKAAKHDDIGFREFVALIAALMAMTAASIDSMLPALPAIGQSLGVVSENTRQWVVAAFVLGFGAGQIIHGPLSDRYGRRPVLLASLGAGVALNLVAAASASFPLLIAARIGSGLAVASSRVLAIAIVRDRYFGRQMARVMSLAMIVFMAAPIIAPSLGTLILMIAPWRWIFGMLAVAGLILLVWSMLRLPETLAPVDRLPLSVARLWSGWRFTLGDRMSLGYLLALTFLQGALFGFINSVQQIFADVFQASHLLSPVFAAAAGTMAVASYFNSRVVVRLGTRFLSHCALLGFIGFAAVHLAVTLAGYESLLAFAILQALMMGCFGLAASNFGAMAMENMGGLAGTASSVQGFISTVIGALIGIAIGQAFNGTTIPLYASFTLCGLAALACVLVTERGRLFRRDEV